MRNNDDLYRNKDVFVRTMMICEGKMIISVQTQMICEGKMFCVNLRLTRDIDKLSSSASLNINIRYAKLQSKISVQGQYDF